VRQNFQMAAIFHIFKTRQMQSAKRCGAQPNGELSKSYPLFNIHLIIRNEFFILKWEDLKNNFYTYLKHYNKGIRGQQQNLY